MNGNLLTGMRSKCECHECTQARYQMQFVAQTQGMAGCASSVGQSLQKGMAKQQVPYQELPYQQGKQV